MRIGLIFILSCSPYVFAANLDPKGLLKANLFGFVPQVEAISGMIDCEDELTNWLEGFGRRIAEGSSDPLMGLLAEDAFNEGWADYKRSLFNAAGGNYSTRVARLLQLIPKRADYEPGRLKTQEGITVDFVNYLVSEFTKLEKTAIVRQAIYEMERTSFPQERARPLKLDAVPGDAGRAYRMILFLRYQMQFVQPEHESGVKIFCDSIFTPELVKASIGSYQIENTAELFRWLREHNPVMYFYFLEKYQPITTEANPMSGGNY